MVRGPPGPRRKVQLAARCFAMALSYQSLVLSDNPAIRLLRKTRRAILDFTLPAPHLVVRPVLWGYLAVRSVYHYLVRVFICEPLFKAYCKQCGRRVRTGIFIHWIEGQGDLIVGDDV